MRTGGEFRRVAGRGATIALLLTIATAYPRAQTAALADPLALARKARDLADVNALQTEIQRQEQLVQKAATLENFLRLSLYQEWMCEAARLNGDAKGAKQAVEAGIAAANRAVELDEKSAGAHRLLGQHLGNLIPMVFAGGMRHGARSTKELDLALSLDPKSAEVYVSRAVSYHFTPGMFGGSEEKAVELLKKAIELDAKNESARIWLAQVYLELKRKDEALKEIQEARRINPERRYAQHIEQVVMGKVKK